MINLVDTFSTNVHLVNPAMLWLFKVIIIDNENMRYLNLSLRLKHL